MKRLRLTSAIRTCQQNQTHGKFATSPRSREFAGTSHSHALGAITEMRQKEITKDIICQVLVEHKSKELIYSVLNEFIPGYEKINLDYTGKPGDENYEFESEDEMIGCYIDKLNIRQTFYWNKYNENPDRIMVGANITEDNQIVFSLTFNGTLETEAKYYLRLKKFLNSEIGVISYINPAEYENGNDFKLRYENEKYEFEK